MAEGTDTQPHTYPPGVPCWVETIQPDADAAIAFYGGLLGWTFHEGLPPGAPGRYVIAELRGKDAAAIADRPPIDGESAAAWVTYIAVASADESAEAATDAGGRVVEEPQDAGPAGRYATIRDPRGSLFRLWEPGRRLGSQVNNAPGSWNFSDLHTTDPQADAAFYQRLFDWRIADMGPDAGAMIRVPGYGEHLRSTVDPGIHERQAGAPEGFADAIGGIAPLDDGETPHWHVTFSVENRDAAATRAEEMGGAVLSRRDGHWAATALIRDPAGAQFTVSQFTAAG